MISPKQFRVWWKPKGKRKGYMIPVSRLIVCDDRGKGWYWQTEVVFDKEDPQILGGITHPMQFTGLWDKNEREIWEGDIVKFYGALATHITKVVYDPPAFEFEDIKTGDRLVFAKYDGKRVTDTDPSQFEILGNVYESKNLLK